MSREKLTKSVGYAVRCSSRLGGEEFAGVEVDAVQAEVEAQVLAQAGDNFLEAGIGLLTVLAGDEELEFGGAFLRLGSLAAIGSRGKLRQVRLFQADERGVAVDSRLSCLDMARLLGYGDICSLGTTASDTVSVFEANGDASSGVSEPVVGSMR
jgi:hypothetical protein